MSRSTPPSPKGAAVTRWQMRAASKVCLFTSGSLIGMASAFLDERSGPNQLVPLAFIVLMVLFGAVLMCASWWYERQPEGSSGD